MTSQSKHCGNREFIALMAMLMSITALTIDAMLPAIDQIARELGATSENDAQLIVSMTFLGMSIGLLFYGPISDSFGRKKAIYLGIAIYLVGSLIALLAQDFNTLIAGRFLQGLGTSTSRIITVAMIRDRFKGAEMAKIMSLIMIIFIMVPALAPTLGQFILYFSHWRTIFLLFIVFGSIAAVWLHFRQPETLKPELKRPFRLSSILSAAWETLKNPIAVGYTLAAAMAFGVFIGYLSSSTQILKIQYGLGEYFSLYFGGLALAIGISSFLNAKIVERFGMQRLCLYAAAYVCGSSLLFITVVSRHNGHPPLWTLLLFLTLAFFCFGILFGNLAALALEPLGHIAGIANSVIGAMQTFLSVVFGAYIGAQYNGTVFPLAWGYVILSSCCLVTIVVTNQKRTSLA